MVPSDGEQLAESGAVRSVKQVMLRLGTLLVERGHLSADRMEELEHRVKWLDEPLDRIIINEKLVDEETLLDLMSGITGIPVVRIVHTEIDPRAVEAVSVRVASHYRIIPLRIDNDGITVASDRVYDVAEEDELSVILGHQIDWRLCRSHEISECIKHYYGVGIQTFLGIGSAGGKQGEEAGKDTVTASESDSISTFVRQVIRDAIQTNATDIHFEPYESELRLRYRIDGVLCQVPLPKGIEKYQKAIISGTKVMAQLNIAEKRLPQDGRFAATVDGASFDIRVSILPSCHGEAVNLRILNREATFLNIEQLGLRDSQLTIVEDLTARANGVVLFTGATGSGKTTSLYAALARLNDAERKIITIEDPIEYQIGGILQMQVHPQIGFTFASGLRSILRHDPDVVLIGEIRDQETASIAISAAMTGHLVFSTLHTNDSASAAIRLIDIGVEPYLVASSVQGIVAQQLVRCICRACKEEIAVESRILDEIRDICSEEIDRKKFYHGRGCPDCRFTGYNGRKAIFEVLVMNDELRALIVERESSTLIMKKAVERGLIRLRESGWAYALEGLTTVDDVLRVTRRQDS